MGISTAFILTLLCYIVTAGNQPQQPGASATPSTATPSTATPSTATPSTATPSTATPSTATPSTSAPTTTAPSLQFSCVDGKVHDIFGSNIKPESIVIYKDGGKICHNTANDCKWKDMKKTLHVRYDKDETNTKVVAGLHPQYYELKCTIGYVASATATVLHIKPQTPSYTHQVIKGTAGPDNGITITLHQKMNPSTTLSVPVDIGEELILKVTGPDKTIGIPISCIANDQTNKVVLWDSEECKSKDTVIMADDWTVQSNAISIKMYAFRFVDSAIVTIKCSAYICPASETDCKTEVKNCLSGAVGRRRRYSDIEPNHLNEYRKQSSSVSFTVVDRYGGVNGSEGVSGNTFLYMTAALITMRLLRGE